MLLVAGIVSVCSVGAPAAADAAFSAPVELGHGPFGVGVVSATDAGGGATAVMLRVDGGARLVQRASGAAAWGASERLPGRKLGKVAGPVVAAAGLGAAAVAWRIDTPKRYGAIVAFARDPGGAFGAPVQVSDEQANGVRHPALAIDPSGHGLLAYNTDTRKAHLSLKGAVAVSTRAVGGAFGAPVVVDAQLSGPPAAAIGVDGKGIVAWLRDRRVWAVTVDTVAGRVGRPTAVTPIGRYGAVHVAAGPDGAATIAFKARKADHPAARWGVAAVRRPPGGSFAGRRLQVVDRIDAGYYLDDVALAADDEGRTTLAWSPERYGQDRSVGFNGVSSTVRFAIAQGGGASTTFGKPRDVDVDGAGRRKLLCSTPSVAAAHGRSVVGYTCSDRKSYTISAATLRGARPTVPQIVLSGPLQPTSYGQTPSASAGLDRTGTATIIATRPDPTTPSTPPGPTTERILAVTGR
ncbi:hypothetical protein DSM104299_03318 [Baekduia alba]|uniref:hypothetical protein n=1 Tax=Baekduia alba TaxID=2997333 RepID=UPI00233FE5C4|nr:hypothetical protein [Baekduia alba]WCB94580.1 hypothetical protein DSM104299_03318 [Baekduia alba]